MGPDLTLGARPARLAVRMAAAARPLLSVVIPALNEEDAIGDTLRRCLAERSRPAPDRDALPFLLSPRPERATIHGALPDTPATRRIVRSLREKIAHPPAPCARVSGSSQYIGVSTG